MQRGAQDWADGTSAQLLAAREKLEQTL